jgi:hypothetical protein
MSSSIAVCIDLILHSGLIELCSPASRSMAICIDGIHCTVTVCRLDHTRKSLLNAEHGSVSGERPRAVLGRGRSFIRRAIACASSIAGLHPPGLGSTVLFDIPAAGIHRPAGAGCGPGEAHDFDNQVRHDNLDVEFDEVSKRVELQVARRSISCRPKTDQYSYQYGVERSMRPMRSIYSDVVKRRYRERHDDLHPWTWR